jgi:hypothetical protein
MPLSQKISPVIVIASLVIIVGVIILIVISPLPWMYYSFLHQQDPNAICLYPPADEKTMSSIWDIIVNRTGIDNSSAAFEGMQVRLTPDETLENLGLSFYATKEGKGRMYSVYLRYDPDRCGTLNIHSYPSDPPNFVIHNPRSPREFLIELPRVRPSAFGISNQSVFITTGVSREINATYYSMPCTDLFLLKNGTIIPLDRMVLHDTEYETSYWNIFDQRCIDIPGYGESCFSNGSILVFSEERIPGSEFVLTNTGNNPVITIHECPHGTVQGQSCKGTFWGESCMNWTAD